MGHPKIFWRWGQLGHLSQIAAGTSDARDDNGGGDFVEGVGELFGVGPEAATQSVAVSILRLEEHGAIRYRDFWMRNFLMRGPHCQSV